MKGELIDNKFHEKWYKIDFNEDKNTLLIKKIIDSTTNKSRLYLGELAINPDDPSPYYIVQIYGGLNGHGEWTDYFEDLTKMAKALEKIGHAWLIELENDCHKIIYYLYIILLFLFINIIN